MKREKHNTVIAIYSFDVSVSAFMGDRDGLAKTRLE